MKPFLLGALLVAVPLVARANDSSFEGVGGSARPTAGENKAIRMVREKVVLTAHPSDYSTQADFVFANETGKAQKVTMGFPEGNFGDVDFKRLDRKTGFRGFKTFVDEHNVPASRVQLHDIDENGFTTYWVKTVAFAPHQTRRVRVQFSSPYGGTVNWGTTRALSYAFTGKNWRGNVGESVLEVRVSQPGLWRTVAMDEHAKPLSFQIQNSANGVTLRRTWKNWQAQDNIVVGLERVVPFWREDVSGADNGSSPLAFINAAQTFRIGPKPASLEGAQGIPPQGFTYSGVFYVSVSHLADKLASWSENQKPKVESKLNFSPVTGFDLRAGKTRIQGREGSKSISVNGKSIMADGPVVGISSGGYDSLYVPLIPIAHALGWKVTMQGDRLFTLNVSSGR